MKTIAVLMDQVAKKFEVTRTDDLYELVKSIEQKMNIKVEFIDIT